MRPIAPRIYGAEEVTIAEEQHEYLPITAAIVHGEDGTVSRVCRWAFTDAEREEIFFKGADLFFVTLASIPLVPHAFRIVERSTEAAL
jgi:hypothetical protein